MPTASATERTGASGVSQTKTTDLREAFEREQATAKDAPPPPAEPPPGEPPPSGSNPA